MDVTQCIAPAYPEHPRTPGQYWDRIGWTAQTDRNFVCPSGNPAYFGYVQGKGRAIRKARMAAGLSQADIATILGCSLSAVYKWENNYHGINPDTLAQITDACGRTAAD